MGKVKDAKSKFTFRFDFTDGVNLLRSIHSLSILRRQNERERRASVQHVLPW